MWKVINKNKLTEFVPDLCRTRSPQIEFVGMKKLKIFVDEATEYKGCYELIDIAVFRRKELVNYLRKYNTPGFYRKDRGLAMQLEKPILPVGGKDIGITFDDLYILHASGHCCPRSIVVKLLYSLQKYYGKEKEEPTKFNL